MAVGTRVGDAAQVTRRGRRHRLCCRRRPPPAPNQFRLLGIDGAGDARLSKVNRSGAARRRRRRRPQLLNVVARLRHPR